MEPVAQKAYVKHYKVVRAGDESHNDYLFNSSIAIRQWCGPHGRTRKIIA